MSTAVSDVRDLMGVSGQATCGSLGGGGGGIIKGLDAQHGVSHAARSNERDACGEH